MPQTPNLVHPLPWVSGTQPATFGRTGCVWDGTAEDSLEKGRSPKIKALSQTGGGRWWRWSDYWVGDGGRGDSWTQPPGSRSLDSPRGSITHRALPSRPPPPTQCPKLLYTPSCPCFQFLPFSTPSIPLGRHTHPLMSLPLVPPPQGKQLHPYTPTHTGPYHRRVTQLPRLHGHRRPAGLGSMRSGLGPQCKPF